MASDVPSTLRAYKYIFEVRTSRRVTGGFSRVSGISEEIEVVDKRDGTNPFQIKKLKGTHQGGSVILERGVVQEKLEFLRWFRDVKKEVVPFWSTFVIHLNPITDPGGQSQTGLPILSLRFLNGWPSRYELGELDAKSSELALEKLALVHEGLEYLGVF